MVVCFWCIYNWENIFVLLPHPEEINPYGIHILPQLINLSIYPNGKHVNCTQCNQYTMNMA